MSVFLQSTLTCHGAGFVEFLDVMRQIKPIAEAAGWRLDRAFVQRTGTLYVVIDIWEMDDFNAYDVGISAITDHPDFPVLSEVLHRTLKSEEITFLEKTDYSP